MPRYDFQCPNGHVSEQLAGHTETSAPCPTCGRTAKRLFNTQVQIIACPVHMIDRNFNSRQRLRAHQNTPEFKKERDSGKTLSWSDSEIETAKQERYKQEDMKAKIEKWNEEGRRNPVAI